MANLYNSITLNSKSRKTFLVLTSVVLFLQVFGIPGLKVNDKELTNYEKAMAALPGWVGANGLPYDPMTGDNVNISNNMGISQFPVLSIDPKTNYPSVAWQDNTDGNYEIYFCKWDGYKWVSAEGLDLSYYPTFINISRSSNDSMHPSLTYDLKNNPCITWSEYTNGNYEIFYINMNDSKRWVNAAGIKYNGINARVTNNMGKSTNPIVSINPITGYPVISWSDNTSGKNNIYITKWNGVTWINYLNETLTSTNGNISNFTFDCYLESFALNKRNGFPSITFSSLYNDILYINWNGESWVNILGDPFTYLNGNVSYNQGQSDCSSMVLENSTGYPHIAWHDTANLKSEIFYVKWDGTNWINANGIVYNGKNAFVTNQSWAFHPELCLNPTNYSPYIVFTAGNDLFFTKFDGNNWLGQSGNLGADNVSNKINNIEWHHSFILDNYGNPCIAWEDSTTSMSREIFYVQWLTSKNSNIRSFIKQVDINADGIFDDNNKPVKPDQTISYRVKVGFDNGAKSTAWIVDKIPYETSYVKGCLPKNKVYYAFPAKNWSFKDKVSGEPEEGASKGTYIVWNADPTEGKDQTFLYKVKVASKNQYLATSSNNKVNDSSSIMSSTVPTICGVNAEPATVIIPDLSFTMQSNRLYNSLETDSSTVKIIDPVEGEKWPIGTGVRLQWTYSGDSDYAANNTLTFILESKGYEITKKDFKLNDIGMASTLPIKYSNWDKLLNRNGETQASLLVKLNNKLIRTIKITLCRHATLNYESWADTNPNSISRHPLIFVHGINLKNQTDSEAEEINWDTFINSFGKEQYDLFKVFKPYVFHYDSGDFFDSFCDYETKFKYPDISGVIDDRELDGIEAVGFELKNEIEKSFKAEPFVFNSNKGLYFVCHSMGGLVTRSFMTEKWTGKSRYFSQDVARVVTLGTPHHGTPVASMSYGGNALLSSKFLRDLSWDNFDMTFDKEDVPNKFLKFLNYLAGNDTTSSGYLDNKIVALAATIGRKPRALLPDYAWIDCTNVLELGIGYFIMSYISNLDETNKVYNTLKVIDFAIDQNVNKQLKFLKLDDNYVKKIDIFDLVEGIKSLVEITATKNSGEKIHLKIDNLQGYNWNYEENDGIVPQCSALLEKAPFKLSYSETFKSSWVIRNYKYLNHYSLCTEPEVLNYTKHAVCSPILKVTPEKIRPGDTFEIEGLSFGNQQSKSTLSLMNRLSNNNLKLNNISSNIQQNELPLQIISWSNNKIVCKLPEKLLNNRKGFYINTLNSVNDNEYDICLRIEGNGVISPVTPINEDNPETGTPTWNGKIIVKTKEDSVSLSIWPSKSQLVKGENVEFTVKAKNTGTTELKNVDIISNIPRELEFISSTIKGIMSNNRLRINLSILKPNETVMFKVLCKLANGSLIPEESGLWLLYTANLTSQNNVNSQASAVVRYMTHKPTENLTMNITWKGIDTKTNIGKTGQPVTLTIDVNGGSMPYYLTIDWGDGKKTKKTWNKMLDPKPVFEKTYERQGETQVTVTCVDAYGKTTSVSRILHIR